MPRTEREHSPFDLYLELESTEREIVLAFPEADLLTQQWEVVRSSGKKLLRHRYNSIVTTTLGASVDEVYAQWDLFIDKAHKSSTEILHDLKISSPEKIRVDYISQRDKVIASMGQTEDGENVMTLYAVPLVIFFIEQLGRPKEFQRVCAWYEFEQVLAHELYHLFENKKFPKTREKSFEREYRDRLREYAARVYAFQWLRKRKVQGMTKNIGLILARAGVLIQDIEPFLPVRDRVNAKFGVKPPSKFEIVRSIVTRM